MSCRTVAPPFTEALAKLRKPSTEKKGKPKSGCCTTIFNGNEKLNIHAQNEMERI